MFFGFKEHLRNIIVRLSSPISNNVYDAFDFPNAVRHSYEGSFTRPVIKEAFANSGLFTMCWEAVVKTPRPASFEAQI